jgi:hypothetical protein
MRGRAAGARMRYLQIALFFAVLAACGGFYWRMVYLEAQNIKLTRELVNANKTITALDEVVKKHNQIRETERNLIDEIEAAPPEDNAPTAPVLLRALERLQ